MANLYLPAQMVARFGKIVLAGDVSVRLIPFALVVDGLFTKPVGRANWYGGVFLVCEVCDVRGAKLKRMTKKGGGYRKWHCKWLSKGWLQWELCESLT